MKIAVGCDPNASALKLEVIEELTSLGHEVTDFGSDDPLYANVAIAVAEAVSRGDYEKGVVLCGTGIGVSLAANKVPGAYCALVTDAYQAERAALSNNANMIALGSQVTGNKTARLLVRTWASLVYKPGGPSDDKNRQIYKYAEEHER
ncbi:RpiB/LacA/LacB family sugar-phosphate isomerase [Breznakiella homolactica]|uniref:RpiB/LacA/LacB family sugar-phosphate isomerase n=1 Tax=Breznakiella homolactica TaxID=2798577 RepID=A0A7T7XP27_9SPIR|nr:RpiB/LacA/LacB family sugar-phosphate isomerase [Breznakiella homolactica]QQO09899.1 RpiB/LacA/LacB family sugar-phosphate isomerase [Breznakiella homolactica]